MSAALSPQAVLDEIATLPRGDDLARLVHTVAFAAADEKRPRIEDGLDEVPERARITAADALRRSRAPAAQTEAAALSREVHDPIVQTLLTGAPAAPEGASGAAVEPGLPGAASPVTGEIVGAPRGPLALVLLGVTGILALIHIGRFFAKVALRYQRPAELRVTSRGVTVISRTELLGKTIRAGETHVPIEALLKASREVRYP